VKEKLTVIPNTVDIDAVAEQSAMAPDPALLRFLDGHHGSFVFIMIGRNDPVKDFPLAYEAFRRLSRTGHSCVLVVVGIEETDSQFAQLRSEYPSSVFGLPPVENAAPALRRSDALLCTSEKEGSPLTVLEAFALGKPVVATDVPGLRDLITDGADGLLCSLTPETIADAMRSISADKTLYRRLSSGAALTASKQSVQSWERRYHSIYSSTRD
jgi:glycosyltransferase involved in cell wall biosynthesis